MADKFVFHTAEEPFTILWCVTSWLLDVANSLSGKSHWVKLPRVLSRRGGRSRGRSPSDRPAARQHPREFDTNNTHTIMFDPDYNMMPPFFHSNQYSAHERQFKVWIESNRSLRCHVTTLSWRQVSQSPPPPVTKMCMPVCCGRLGMWNRTAPDQHHLLPVATTKLIMRCVYKLDFRCTLSFPMKITSSTQLWYIRASAGRYVFMGSPSWWRFGLCSSGSSLVSRWRDMILRSCTREFQMWHRRCKQIDPHWFQGRQMRFWWMLSTISWK